MDIYAAILPPPLAIPSSVFTSYHYLSSHHLLHLTHPLWKCMRIWLFHWDEVKSVCRYGFYNHIDWSSNSGLPLALWTRTGYLTSLTLRFLMIASTFLSMMRNQWDRLCKAPSTVPSRQFLPRRHQLPTSCISKGMLSLCTWESDSHHSRLSLSPPCPEMLRHHPARKAPFPTHQSITPGLTTLSISAYTHFLISFLLSGLAFIASTCFSLSSVWEFMLPSSIHLPATSANSYWGKDLIF